MVLYLHIQKIIKENPWFFHFAKRPTPTYLIGSVDDKPVNSNYAPYHNSSSRQAIII
jgi:hypothetical protein